MSQKRQVRARFWGTGMVASEHISARGAAATVTESFMIERKAPDVVAMWLDGTRHPKVGILGLPPVDAAAVPYTGKRLRNWQQLEPWNREKVHSSSGTRSLDHVRDRDFWEWFDSSICNSHPGPHLHELVLQGSDHATLEYAEGEDTHPGQEENLSVVVPPHAKISRRNIDDQAGSRRWIEEKTRDSQHQTSAGVFFYDRILSSIIMPEPAGSQPHPLLTDAQLAADPSAVIPIPNMGIRKRTLIELGTLGVLRELDGDWLALEEEASATDLDSEISRETRALIQVLKNEERIVNAHISRLRRRVENDETVFGNREDAASLKTTEKWQKLQRKKFQILEQKFLERLGID